jgi:hypothetical protein
MQALNKTSAYHWYLGSAFWRERREWALKRASYRCEKCKEAPATQVHHVTYLRVFNEIPSDLLAICESCHKKLHHKQAANDNQISFKFD